MSDETRWVANAGAFVSYNPNEESIAQAFQRIIGEKEAELDAVRRMLNRALIALKQDHRACFHDPEYYCSTAELIREIEQVEK